MTDATASPTQLRTLTDRQLQVLVAISQGYTNQEIGRQLDVAADTVKQISLRMYRNLGARDRAHAVHMGHQFGILGRHDLGETLAATVKRRLDGYQRLYERFGNEDDLASANAYRSALADLGVSTDDAEETLDGAA